jgi:hypothetical protein
VIAGAERSERPEDALLAEKARGSLAMMESPGPGGFFPMPAANRDDEDEFEDAEDDFGDVLPSPGSFRDMVRDMINRMAGHHGLDPDELADQLANELPFDLGKLPGNPSPKRRKAKQSKGAKHTEEL